jgi:uncharacterized protein involved in exopolysaccharide biosynthesis
VLYRRDSITFRLLDAFFRNLGIFLLCVVGVSSVVAVALVTRSQSYVASSSIRVIGEGDLQKITNTRSLRPWESPAKKHTARFTDLMQDLRPSGFVNSVLEAAKLKKPINTNPDARDPRFEKFRKSVFTSTKSKELFSIGLTWENEEECERLVEAIQERFIADIGETSQAESIKTVSFLDSQIKSARTNLQNAEQALQDFQTKNLGKLPGSRAAEIEQLASLKSNRDLLEITSQDFALKRSAIQDRLKQVRPESILERTVGTDPLVSIIRDLEAKRADLIRRKYQRDGTLVRDVDQQISLFRQDLAKRAKQDPTQSANVTETKLQDNPEYGTLQQQLTITDMDESAHKAQLANLNRRIADYEKVVQQMPSAERTLIERTRDQQFWEKTYNDLVARRYQAQMKADVGKITETAKLIPQALIRAEPTMSLTKMVMLIGGSVILGLIVGCLMILAREWMDVSLRYTMDAERLLGVPVLAALPESPVLQFPLSTPRNGRLRGRATGSNTGALPAPPGIE